MTFYGKKRLETKEDKKGEGRTSIKNIAKNAHWIYGLYRLRIAQSIRQSAG
jgi:hypothetical protein